VNHIRPISYTNLHSILALMSVYCRHNSNIVELNALDTTLIRVRRYFSFASLSISQAYRKIFQVEVVHTNEQ
jgi:hypothetical protein